MPGAKDLGYQTAGQRHGAQPGQPHDSGEDHHGRVCLRQQEEHGDGNAPDQIEPSQDVLLAHLAAQPAAGPGTGHVEQADRGQRCRTQPSRHVADDQVARQVGCDEGELEAAGEEAECQENVAAMMQCQGENVAERVGELRSRRGTCVTPVEGDPERGDDGHQDGKPQQRDGDAEAFVGELRCRHQDELAERSAGARDTHRHAAALGRCHAADRGQHHGEGRAAHTDADQQAHADHEEEARRSDGRQGKAGRESQGADCHDRRRPIAVGGGAGKRLGKAPDEVMQGDRERDQAQRYPSIDGYWSDEQSECLADPHRRTQDEGARDDHRRGLAS